MNTNNVSGINLNEMYYVYRIAQDRAIAEEERARRERELIESQLAAISMVLFNGTTATTAIPAPCTPPPTIADTEPGPEPESPETPGFEPVDESDPEQEEDWEEEQEDKQDESEEEDDLDDDDDDESGAAEDEPEPDFWKRPRLKFNRGFDNIILVVHNGETRSVKFGPRVYNQIRTLYNTPDRQMTFDEFADVIGEGYDPQLTLEERIQSSVERICCQTRDKSFPFKASIRGETVNLNYRE